jgi:hypothetical protein
LLAAGDHEPVLTDNALPGTAEPEMDGAATFWRAPPAVTATGLLIDEPSA